MITTALTGNLMELLRVGDICVLVLKLCTSRSWPELRARSNYGFKKSAFFWFGEEYSWVLLHLYVTVSLSIAFPLITPIGLIYFVIKHFVDMYNLGNAFKPTKVNFNFHLSAISFVIGSSVLLQFYNLLYIALNSSRLNLKSKVAGFLTIFSLLLHVVQMASQWTWPFEVFPEEIVRKKKLQQDKHLFWPPFHPKIPRPL